jgi:hypothetical protein
MTYTPDNPLRVMSLGAGLQSSVLLLMMLRGEIANPVTHAIFSDTGWEPRAVYAHLDWLEGECRRLHRLGAPKVEIIRTGKGTIREDALRSQVRGKVAAGGRWASMPLYVKGTTHKVDVSAGPLFGAEPKFEVIFRPDGMGRINRQCTSEYKIQVVQRELRRLLGLRHRQRWPAEHGVLEQTFGISYDERTRMTTAEFRAIRNRYPLVYEKPTHRQDLRAWAEQHYPSRRFPRSSCIGCPFHSNDEWRRLRDEDSEGWADAVDFDRRIRNIAGMQGECFLHRDCVPLEEADLGQPDRTQNSLISLGVLDECTGYCGN